MEVPVVTVRDMIRACYFALATALFALGTPPIPQAPAFVYKLHTSKQTRFVSYLARTPDNAVLVFAPQSGDCWSLIRVTGLALASPREEQLTIIGLTPEQLQNDDAKGWGSIDVSPDGHYAVVRTQTWKIGPLPTVERKDARATVAVIDLQSWKVVSARSTTDPMYAGSLWAFSKDGVLMAESNPTSTGKPGHFAQAYSITHKAVSLLLPDLKPSLACNYTEVYGPYSDSGASSHRDYSVTDLSGSCPELVKLADASSVKNIYHPHDALGRVAEQLHFEPKEFAPTPSGVTFNGCQIEDLGVGERFALYVCTRSHLTWYDTRKYTAVSLSVVSVADRKEELRVPCPLEGPPTAILVTISGEDYLVILEKGVNLIVYRF